MSTAASPQQDAGLTLGAEEAKGEGRIFVNLRIGKIAQTSNEPREGFKPASTKNKDGSVNNFFAKSYEKITGYVTDIRWHTHTLRDGTVLAGWNITIDTTNEVFVLGVNKNDRPYQRVMNTLLNVDFERPVMFVGFMGKDKQDRPQKVLLLSQELGENKKPCWLQAYHEEKWLSRIIIDKLKQGVGLTEQEERQVSRDQNGNFSKEYPYIVQGADGKWSWDVWNNFLYEQMTDRVIPEVERIASERGAIARDSAVDDLPAEEFSGPMSGPGPAYDDDIPF